MKVLLCLCACIAASTAHGVIGYPAVPLAYHNNYITPVTTITRPLGVAYTGIHSYPVAVGPYFSYNLIPNNLVFPGVVHYIPLAPPKEKGKPDKKKPGEKADKDNKEETTEESKTDQEAETKTDEGEELAH